VSPSIKVKISELPKFGNKFMRRPDLTPSDRLHIAITALYAMRVGKWGAITNIAKQFIVSRTFVYMLATTLTETESLIFGTAFQNSHSKIKAFQYMLSLRLEGRCSIGAISTLMKRFEIDLGSTGSVSEYLTHFGSLLPDTLSTNNTEIQLVVFLSDEIFSKNIPILVTVEPISSAILRIELADSRKADKWKNHWHCIEDNGYLSVYLACDEGKGLTTAHKESLSDIVRQPDTYHAIAHRLGKWAHILKNAAYNAIEEEYERYEKLNSAKSDRVIDKRIDQYEAAQKVANEKIDLYEEFNSLYIAVLNELKLFDKNGNLRDRKDAEDNMEDYLSLIETLNHENITNAVKKIRNTMPDLFNYFDVAKSIVADLKKTLPIDEEALQALCLAWQWKKGKIKAKKAKAKKYCAANEQDCLEYAIGYLQEDYEDVKDQVYDKLSNIVQSSALVECINSIIRPYLNTSKNHVTQSMLNLIMFYHNHRRYVDGERKGYTPIEILTGKKQEKDWIELLFDIVEEKDPCFFATIS
jgi:hypothetical protein